MNTLEFLRQFRIFDYAAFDLIVSLLGMWLLSYPLSKAFLKIGLIIPKKSWVIWALPIGIIAHLLIGTMTPMTLQFIDPGSNYILKVVIVLLTIFGFQGVRKVKKDIHLK